MPRHGHWRGTPVRRAAPFEQLSVAEGMREGAARTGPGWVHTLGPATITVLLHLGPLVSAYAGGRGGRAGRAAAPG